MVIIMTDGKKSKEKLTLTIWYLILGDFDFATLCGDDAAERKDESN